MKDFIKDLKNRGGHVLRKCTTYDGKIMLYYSELNSFVTDIKIKTFGK